MCLQQFFEHRQSLCGSDEWCCRLFHACGSACAKAGSLNDVVVRGMMRSPTAADRKRRLGSDRATGMQSSVK